MKCYDYHNTNKSVCVKKDCRYWMESNSCKNCCIIGAKNNEQATLEEIGQIFSVTRMRICQIEKIAIKKIKEKINLLIQ